MDKRIFSEIQDAIQKVIDEACEGDRWPNFTCPPKIAERMTEAAETVFDCAVETSQYQEKETA